MERHQVIIHTERCVGCGMCAAECCTHTIVIQDKKAVLQSDGCILCGHCSAICPKEAVSISGYDAGPEEQRAAPRLDPDEVLEVIRFRRTVRRFQQAEIPRQVIAQILEAGRLTHTAKNMQDVSFVVLEREKDNMERLAVRLFRRLKPLADLTSPAARNTPVDDHFFFFQAPTVIVILAKEKQNGLLAAQNMEFVAEAHGLGVLFSGFFTMAANCSRRLKKALAVPRGRRVAATLVLGYPDVKFLRAAPRRALEASYR